MSELAWAVVELMGHVRMAGLLTEEERFGAKLGRLDVPKGDGFVTTFFGGQSVYRITPCTEEAARAVAAHNQPSPVHTWELPRPALASPAETKLTPASHIEDLDNEDDDQDRDIPY